MCLKALLLHLLLLVPIVLLNLAHFVVQLVNVRNAHYNSRIVLKYLVAQLFQIVSCRCILLVQLLVDTHLGGALQYAQEVLQVVVVEVLARVQR